jgi:hypothetical protein
MFLIVGGELTLPIGIVFIMAKFFNGFTQLEHNHDCSNILLPQARNAFIFPTQSIRTTTFML